MAGELFERFERVMERLRRAEAEAGRPRGVVALTAVSKYHPASAVADLARYWAERAEARKAAAEAHALDPALVNAGIVDSYAGTAGVPPDGQTMGDALPPAIPLDANGRSGALH